jgi:hypothetical protein
VFFCVILNAVKDLSSPLIRSATRDPSAKPITVAGGCFAVQDDKGRIRNK